jgi:membrane-associated phospholipid phosphatase
MSTTRTAAVRTAAHRVSTSARAALVRLIPAAIVLWALEVGLGELITHALRGTGFERWDASVNRTLASHRSELWNTITHLATTAAETTTVIGVAVVFFIGMRVRLGRWRESMFLAVALLGEVTIFVCTTMVVDRTRPAVSHLDAAPPTSSFPSGHTAATVALFGALAVIAWTASNRHWLRSLAAVAAVAMPIAVGVSRLYRGMHYPTDVLAGALLGLLWLTITGVVLLRTARSS